MAAAEPGAAVPAVEAIGLAKRYGEVEALKPTSFRIEAGSYFVLLGPSGGGKTTTLRLIGGLIRPSAGRVLIAGHDVTGLPPNRRNTSMVFQSYALFPHMDVERNVGYGLRLRRLPREQVRAQVAAMLELVGLSGLERRMPHELSGGQQQRVQLARSLVLNSDILLLDEPLAALDAQLRKDMCLELKHIQAQVGITFVHVTHNQEEAMTIADRIAVMADGELVEQGAPREVYERPRRRFTAAFIGENNLLQGRIAGLADGLAQVDLGYATVSVPCPEGAPVGAEVTVSLRSELAGLAAPGEAGEGRQRLPASFVEQVYLGFSTSSLVRLPDGAEAVSRQSGAAGAAPALGAAVALTWATGDARLHLD